ncbi:MAG: response regulator [Deltaproteobacteria bacterium]|nr:response regulator [Deltaproteobacteria bacterium]
MDTGSKILISSGDKKELAYLGRYLKEKGFNPLLARDGAAALELALTERPLLMVTEVNLPLLEAERLLQILRNNPYTAGIPFIFIGHENIDIKGFRRDTDAFLIKPIKPDELLIRIHHHLTETRVREGIVAAKEIEGSLSHISVVDLLQILHLNKKEGVLRMFQGNQEGAVYLKDGIIYNAVINNIEREKALYRLLTWKDGRFEFLPRPIDILPQTHRSPGSLLMEGMRQYDEWEKSKGQFPKAQSVLEKRIDSSRLPEGLKPIIYEIIFLVDIYPKVGDLVDHSSFPDYEVYQTIASLLRKGALKEVKGGVEDGLGVPKELLTQVQALKLVERVSVRWPELEPTNRWKVIILSPKGDPVMRFIDACKSISGFSVDRQFITSPLYRERPLGEIGFIKIYGGTEIALFVLPVEKGMMPLWKAFLKGMIGIVVIWDREGINGLRDIAFAREHLLSIKRVPAVYGFSSPDKAMDDEEGVRKVLAMRRDEPISLFGSKERGRVFQIFHALFGCILKEGYA